MEHREHKRKASPSALDADDTPDAKIKAIGVEEKEEKVEEGCDDEYEGLSLHKYRLTHLLRKQTKIECFFKALHTEILTQKVVKLTQLKPKIDELNSSLGRINEDGFDLQNFAGKVNDLFACSLFIEACGEAAEEEFGLFHDIELYKSEDQVGERRDKILKDGFLPQVLNGVDNSAITRGVLSVLLAYWCDDGFYRKGRVAFSNVVKRLYPGFARKPKQVDEINVSESVEGSKEKLSADEAI